MNLIFRIVKALIRELTAPLALLIINYPNTRLGFLLRKIYYKHLLKIKIGKSPKICRTVQIYNEAPIEIGNYLTSGRNVTINPNDSFGIIIGNNVGIAEGSYLRSGNHAYSDPDKPFIEQGHIAKKVLTQDGREASIIIEDDVWISAQCTILSGAKIGKGSIIAAGSVVAGKLPEYCIALGNPARPIASRKNTSFSKKYYKFP